MDALSLARLAASAPEERAIEATAAMRDFFMGREFYFVFSTTRAGPVVERNNFFDAGPVVNGKMAKT